MLNVSATGKGAKVTADKAKVIFLWKGRVTEKVVELFLFFSAVFSVVVTAGIVYVLIQESLLFFRNVSVVEFFTSTQWSPLFANPRFGILPLVSGTLVTTLIAVIVSLPLGTVIAVWLSEFSTPKFREIIKPVLELLSAVPTVVYGYFAVKFVVPALQLIIPNLPTFNMLGAGLVMGIMIIPYVSSLSEDSMRSVPMLLREGAYALGGNKLTTAIKVVFPASLSGIAAAYVLAISRALGETMIVAIAAGMQPTFTINPLNPAATITAFIVQVSQGDLPHGTVGYQSIFAAGLTLFFMTLAFNVVGYILKNRFKESY